MSEVSLPNPRFHSTHLEFPRREIYRARRDDVLHSSGAKTYAMVKQGFETPKGAIILCGAVGHPEDSGFQTVAGTTTHSLGPGFNTIGRQRDNHIVLADDTLHVSRRHAAIVVHANGQAEIFDLASLNGTFVNGSQVHERAPLRSNDVVRLGSYCSFTVILYERTGN